MHGFIPTGFFETYISKDNPFAVPIAVILGIPMYSNAAGVLPIIQVFVQNNAQSKGDFNDGIRLSGYVCPCFSRERSSTCKCIRFFRDARLRRVRSHGDAGVLVTAHEPAEHGDDQRRACQLVRYQHRTHLSPPVRAAAMAVRCASLPRASITGRQPLPSAPIRKATGASASLAGIEW